MNRKIIIASHGTMAQGMADSVKLITGNNHLNINTYALEPGGSADDFKTDIEQGINNHPDSEFLIFTDIKGASVANALIQLSAFNNVHVFTGTNLAMLIMVCVQYTQPLDDKDIESILAQARNGIEELKIPDNLNDDNEF